MYTVIKKIKEALTKSGNEYIGRNQAVSSFFKYLKKQKYHFIAVIIRDITAVGKFGTPVTLLFPKKKTIETDNLVFIKMDLDTACNFQDTEIQNRYLTALSLDSILRLMIAHYARNKR